MQELNAGVEAKAGRLVRELLRVLERNTSEQVDQTNASAAGSQVFTLEYMRTSMQAPRALLHCALHLTAARTSLRWYFRCAQIPGVFSLSPGPTRPTPSTARPTSRPTPCPLLYHSLFSLGHGVEETRGIAWIRWGRRKRLLNSVLISATLPVC